MRDHLFKHMQTLPVSFYSNNKTGNLVAYAINDVQALRMTFGFAFVHILDGIAATSISIFFMSGTINRDLTLYALGPVPIAIFVIVLVGKQIRGRFRKVQEAFAVISDKVQENISGIRVIKAFAQEKEEVDNFLKCSRQRVDTQMELTRVSALLGPCAQVCFGISFLLFIVYGSGQVVKGVITLGDYVAFNSYLMAIMGPVMSISRVIDVFQRGIASFKRLNEIFDTPAGITQPDAEPEVSDIQGGLEIRNLGFSYPGALRRALKNIIIKLDRGRTLGILG